jgi:hypothetical protein
VSGILEFNSFLAGTGYPTCKNTRVGTSMSKILYPRVYMGNPTGRIFFYRYEYGMVLPDGYIPVAIPNDSRQQSRVPAVSWCTLCWTGRAPSLTGDKAPKWHMPLASLFHLRWRGVPSFSFSLVFKLFFCIVP